MVCDSSLIVCGLLDKTISVYKRGSLDLLERITGVHTDHIWAMDLNEKYLVSGSWDSTAKIWTRSKWEMTFSYPFPDGREISGVR